MIRQHLGPLEKLKYPMHVQYKLPDVGLAEEISPGIVVLLL